MDEQRIGSERKSFKGVEEEGRFPPRRTSLWLEECEEVYG
jgi:hypothetical protein